MAIKGKTETAATALAPKLAEHVRRAFSFQGLSSAYDDAFKGEKALVLDFLKNDPAAPTLTVGKAFNVPEGTITVTLPEKWAVDKAELVALVERGDVSLASLVEAANFNMSKLKTALAGNFSRVATPEKPTESFTFKANAAFKAELERSFTIEPAADTPAPAPAAPAAAPKAKAKPKADLAESLAKAEAAAKQVDDDLDTILGGK